jgi:predicted phage terminase large subunit-like protein
MNYEIPTFNNNLCTSKKKPNHINQKYDWNHLARDNQKEPAGEWLIWLILAGRGFGKTRTGAQTVARWVSQGYRRIALIGHTQAEVRQVMLEGESGLLGIYPPEKRPLYEPSKRQITWPNGAVAHTFSAENIEQLRGPQFDAAWIDEYAKFPIPEEVLDQLMFGLRLGSRPKIIMTTTPRAIAALKTLCAREDCIVTRGSTFDNAANLSKPYLEALRQKYEGTPLGRQEVHGQIVENETLLWRPEDILYVPTVRCGEFLMETARRQLAQVVLGLDPAVTAGEESDETGIIIAGRDRSQNLYVLEDFSLKAPVEQWTQYVAHLAAQWRVDQVVGEVNQGGDLVRGLLRSAHLKCPFVGVRAVADKQTRALPVVMRYRQHQVYHQRQFISLEKQMLAFDGISRGHSPDRVDALVWALDHLMKVPSPTFRMW